ncbi:unnamed protein product [Effrenium voratum]|nr:unnamed protein product [Effrenium voratum]
MFDSSVKRGQKATFGVSQVIKGWTEGLQLMAPGEKRRFWIPAALAYGENPGGGRPGGLLVFDVELYSVDQGPRVPTPEDVQAPPETAERTASGIASRVLKPGVGKQNPSKTSIVTVDYSGWTSDGQLFDSSVIRGAPATFRLDQVIPGWTEGVQLMVFSTSQKKYGDFESHQQIKPATMMDIPLEPERQVHGTPYPPPSDVRCGGDFTLLLVRDSPDWYPPEEESQRLFCCGENGKGQCGRSLQQQQQVFAACKLPRNSKMLGFSCGSDHCVAVIKRIDSRKQELWCWGHNAEGQAGGSNSGAVCPAARLRLPRGARVEDTAPNLAPHITGSARHGSATLGVELRELRLARPLPRLRLAVVAASAALRRVHVSEAAEASARPRWKAAAWKLNLPKGQALQIQLRLYEGVECDERTLLEHALPLSSCSFDLVESSLQDLLMEEQVRSAPLFTHAGPDSEWRELGVVTIALGWPSPSHVKLVPPEQLVVKPPPPRSPASPSSSAAAAAAAAARLGPMVRREQRALQVLAGRLGALQRQLTALQRHAEELNKERDLQLHKMKQNEQQLQQLQEPDLTDLDVELLVAASGLRGFQRLLLAAEQRWRQMREAVIARWGEFQALREKNLQTQQLQRQVDEFQKVREEQRKALDAAARRAKEARHLAQTCEAQATLIAELKARSQNTVQPAELMLVHCREQTLHDILHEKCEQLDLRVGRSRAEPEVPPLEAARLAKAVFQRTQQAMELLAEIELHSRRTQSEDVAPSTATRDRKSAAKIPRAARASKSAPARADLLEDAMQAMTAAQLRCEEAERQCSVAEEQLLHKQSGTWGQELGRLQRELQQKNARLSQLQRFMGVH